MTGDVGGLGRLVVEDKVVPVKLTVLRQPTLQREREKYFPFFLSLIYEERMKKKTKETRGNIKLIHKIKMTINILIGPAIASKTRNNSRARQLLDCFYIIIDNKIHIFLCK